MTEDRDDIKQQRTFDSRVKKLAVQRSEESFLVDQIMVLRINTESYQHGKNRQLPAAVKRF
jgi:hypothetical protein